MDFDKVAKVWDTDYREKRGSIVASEISKFLDSKKDKVALEIGCGTGLVSLNLSDSFKELDLIDNSKEMIEVLREKINSKGIKNINPINCSIEDLKDFKKYDFIFSSLVLHHIDDIKLMFLKIKNLLNINGKVCIVDFVNDNGEFHADEKEFKGHDGFNVKSLKEIIKDSGFKNIESYDFYNGIKTNSLGKVKYTLFIISFEI
ncbi:MAG: class I SAM-dependent methyltransferase [Clostridium sp.]|uniref:class I SAM-dependent methyltransferase n=1 Tax=Clostridium TaxID=1485 RepID=UPI00215399AD|nr:class I SAM-dependent methyltransferase [Clostridium sp. LY3-2]MCR6514209.1 class I SAM-dependent methyltransferase [Clostridium sp. LY3-2]